MMEAHSREDLMIESKFVEQGDALIEAAQTITLGTLQERFKRFVKAHQAWTSADTLVAKASEREGGHRLDKGEADAAQDALVDELAQSLAADGFNRINPFKGFITFSPSRLQKLGDAAEAQAAQQLVRAIAKSKQASAKSKAIATRLARAAGQVLALNKQVVAADLSTKSKRQTRNALLSEWTKSYALLKAAAKLLKADGNTVPYDTLFPAPAKKPKPATATEPVTP